MLDTETKAVLLITFVITYFCFAGDWEIDHPRKLPIDGDQGLVFKQKAKHRAISSKLNRPFVFTDKPLYLQYEVLFQDTQECGGAYLKLLSEGPETADLKNFHDKTPYTIMFGPDKCGNTHHVRNINTFLLNRFINEIDVVGFKQYLHLCLESIDIRRVFISFQFFPVALHLPSQEPSQWILRRETLQRPIKED